MTRFPEPLAELIRSEIESPGSAGDVVARAIEAWPDAEPLLRFLELKDLQHRHAYYVKAEHVLFRRLGWRLMRPLFVLALAAAGGAILLQRTIDPTLALGLFLAGACSFYIVLQIFLHRWAWKDMSKLETIENEYRKGLRELLESAG